MKVREPQGRWFDRPSGRAAGAGILAGLAVAAYLLVCHLVLMPMHVRGSHTGLLSAVNGLGQVFESPGRGIVRVVSHIRPIPSPIRWRWAVPISSCLMSCGVFALAWFLCRFSPKPLPLDGQARHCTDDEEPTRRSLLRRGVGLAIGSAGATLGYSLLIEPRSVQVCRQSVPIRGLPPTLQGLRIVQLSDIHHGAWMDVAYVRSVVDTAQSLKPDLVLLTGDYIHDNVQYAAPVAEALAEVRGTVGTLAVLGNHDWSVDVDEVRRQFRRCGIPLIDNNRLIVTRDRTLRSNAREGLCVAGLGDLWFELPRFDLALRGVPDDMPRLLLSHNPDAAEDPLLVQGGHRIDLMLSGHTHGGQVWVPGLGTPIIPSKFGRKYAAGLVRGPVCPVYVNRGIGVSGLPLRFGVPPEITVIELRAA